MKTYTNRYLFERLKAIRLLFVMYSRSIGGAIRMARLSVQKNIQPFEHCCYRLEKKFHLLGWQTFQFRIQNYSAFQTAEVFRTLKRIQSDSAFQDTLDLPNCPTFLSQGTSLRWCIFQRYCSTDVKIILSFLSLSLHKNQRTRRQNKPFCSIVRLFPP